MGRIIVPTRGIHVRGRSPFLDRPGIPFVGGAAAFVYVNSDGVTVTETYNRVPPGTLSSYVTYTRNGESLSYSGSVVVGNTIVRTLASTTYSTDTLTASHSGGAFSGVSVDVSAAPVGGEVEDQFGDVITDQNDYAIIWEAA